MNDLTQSRQAAKWENMTGNDVAKGVVDCAFKALINFSEALIKTGIKSVVNDLYPCPRSGRLGVFAASRENNPS